eukprot:scaffold32256_cov69-Phaeocystis_antarctica.AAC.7
MPSDAVLTSKCLVAWPHQIQCERSSLRCAHACGCSDAAACRAVQLHSQGRCAPGVPRQAQRCDRVGLVDHMLLRCQHQRHTWCSTTTITR